MGYFKDNRTVNFDELEKAVNKDGKRVYPPKLIQQLRNGNFNILNEINASYRNNRTLMEPLLYAVKNSEYGTYEVYKYYGEELQKRDLTIATEIASREPKIFEDTPISSNDTMMLTLAKINPEIVLYISENLKNDGDFIQDLCEECSKEAVMYAIRECNVSEVLQDNPELATNPAFMKEAIKEDASILSKLDENYKNDYEFVREISQANPEVINYIVGHTEEFGAEALSATRASIEENFITDATKDIQEERKKLELEKAQLESEEVETSKKATSLKQREKNLTSIEEHIAKFQALPEDKKPRVASLYLKVLQDIPEHYRTELEKYNTIYIAEKAKRKENQKSNNRTVTPEQIENVTAGKKIRTSEINEVTRDIREEYENERQTELGGENDRGTDEERT